MSMELSYWNTSKNIYYSIIFVFPMVVLYELMCWLQFLGSEYQIRNGADVFLRQLFIMFGDYSELAYSSSLLIILLLIMFFNRDVIREGRLRISYLLFMLFESLFWCTVFIILMSFLENIPLSIMDRNIVPEHFYLSIGAGIWEEILFRVGAITFTVYLLKYILSYAHLFAISFAIISSALLFSLFHYIGQFGDLFTFRSFYIRTIAGIILGILYIFRGFGITAYTHIFYDISIISIPIIMNNS